MSIIIKEGSLFDESFDALVNPVNCVGVMGAGLALQFKLRFPENFEEYKDRCMSRSLHLGQVFMHCTSMECPRFIINFPTKAHWRDHSKLRYVASGLADLVEHVKKFDITSIGMPALGCGLGGLRWNEVKPVIVDALKPLQNLSVTLFLPRNILQEQRSESII